MAGDAHFTPRVDKLPVPSRGEDLHEYLARLVARLNDYEDVDVQFIAGQTTAVRHRLGRIPSGFVVLFNDSATTINAEPTTGWGSKVVYFNSSGDTRARIRLL